MRKRLIGILLSLAVLITLCAAACIVSYAEESYLWPVPSGTSMSRGFTSGGHEALDITASGGNILATKSGTVVIAYTGCGNKDAAKTGTDCSKNTCSLKNAYTNKDYNIYVCNWGYGNGVVIKHSDGSGYSMYAHMATVNVSSGDTVKQGQVLGTMGSTGCSTGRHLHFALSKSVKKSGTYYKPVDPINNNRDKIDYIYSLSNTLTMKYNANGGSVSASGYSQTSAGMIQLNGSDVTRKWEYGKGDSTYGLVNATTFGLTKSGYSFVGWCLNKNGSGTVFDEDITSYKAETIYPDVKNGSATVTLYAVWAKYDYAGIQEGIYTLTPKHAAGMRLDIKGASTENGANAHIYTSNNSAAQQFRIHSYSIYGSGYIDYLIEAVCSGKKLNVTDGGKISGTNVQQWGTTDTNSRWIITNAGDGYYYIRPYVDFGLCLDVYGGKTANSTNVQLYMLRNTDNQNWKLTKLQDSYNLIAYNNYSGKNYLYNTDFNSLDSSHWINRDTSVTTLSVDKSNTHNGHNSLKIVNSSAGASGKDLAVATTTQNSKDHGGVGQSDNMVLSFWAKSSVAGTKMFFRWGYESTSNYRSVTLGTDWQKYTVAMNKTADFNHYFHPYINQAGTVWISEVQLEDGTSPTEFVPETGSVYTTVSEPLGSKYTMPGTPTREGYTFDGWYTSAKGGSLFSSSTLVKSGDVAVYAHWTKNEEDPADERENPFVDVDEDDEFYDAVMWAYYADPQITNGIDATHFGPMKTVTRGQCAAFLWRAMGCPEPESTYNPFRDVSSKQYYYKPILWAVENGITLGTSADTYSPDDTLTTQHIVTFIYRTQNPGEDGWNGEAAEWAADRKGRPFGVDVEVNNWTPCPRAYVVMFLQEVQ